MFDTLLVLVERHGRLAGKEELMRAVWPEQCVGEGDLNEDIPTVRRALGEDPARHAYIERCRSGASASPRACGG
jgi:DNA-binding winged helix-turn-helix (wHTH) protein